MLCDTELDSHRYSFNVSIGLMAAIAIGISCPDNVLQQTALVTVLVLLVALGESVVDFKALFDHTVTCFVMFVW